jgi:hypothetical protein
MAGGNLRERSPRKIFSVSAQAKLTITNTAYRMAITSQGHECSLRKAAHGNEIQNLPTLADSRKKRGKTNQDET